MKPAMLWSGQSAVSSCQIGLLSMAAGDTVHSSQDLMMGDTGAVMGHALPVVSRYMFTMCFCMEVVILMCAE